MKGKGLDLQTRRVLQAVLAHPRASLATVANDLGMSEEVVRARLQKLEDNGILRGYRARVDPARLGMPHEVFVQGIPSAETTRGALENLCAQPGVTRVLALASRASIAFTVRGEDVDVVTTHAADLATSVGLLESTVTLIVDTLHDDPASALGPALTDSQSITLDAR